MLWLSLKHSELEKSGLKKIGVLNSFQNHLSCEDFRRSVYKVILEWQVLENDQLNTYQAVVFTSGFCAMT